jgi:hypothetical protein
MSNKKELHKIMGDPITLESRMIRTGLSAPELKQCDDRFGKITWKEKPEPRSSWYPRTPDMHIYGKKV